VNARSRPWDSEKRPTAKAATPTPTLCFTLTWT
jgi:hypothetical protein